MRACRSSRESITAGRPRSVAATLDMDERADPRRALVSTEALWTPASCSSRTIRRSGHVFTRDVLLDRVWGYGYLGDSRLVDVAIGRLRARVEADPTAPELTLTVRGSGYKAVRAAG